MWTSLRDKTPEAPIIQGPYTFVSCILGALRSLHSEDKIKITLAYQHGWEKRAILKYATALCS